MAVRPSFAFPASFRVVLPLSGWLGFCPASCMASLCLVGVFLVPCLLYRCGSGKTAYLAGAVLVVGVPCCVWGGSLPVLAGVRV